MSLEKAIKHKKEKRKQHYGSKRFDWSCRNNGSCTYCAQGRQHFDTKRRKALEIDMKEWRKNEDNC
jgi:hypothetical protein